MLNDVLRCFLRHSQYAATASMFAFVRSDADGFHCKSTIATADIKSYRRTRRIIQPSRRCNSVSHTGTHARLGRTVRGASTHLFIRLMCA
jgi:hypothetical protein